MVGDTLLRKAPQEAAVSVDCPFRTALRGNCSGAGAGLPRCVKDFGLSPKQSEVMGRFEAVGTQSEVQF